MLIILLKEIKNLYCVSSYFRSYIAYNSLFRYGWNRRSIFNFGKRRKNDMIRFLLIIKFIYKNKKMDRIKLLIKKSKKLFKEDKATVHLVNNEEQNKFLNDLEKCPHAFVLACLMDRQINAERAWAIPYKIYKEVGTFNIYKLKEKGKEYYKELFNKNKFHRFNNDMAEIFYNGICRIIDKY